MEFTGMTKRAKDGTLESIPPRAVKIRSGGHRGKS